MRGKVPNAAHRAIAAIEKRGCWVIVATQNIDGLHQDAGSSRVIELHGNLRRLCCTRCSYQHYFVTFKNLPPLPTCPKCKAIVRPDAVLYGEMLPASAVKSLESEQRTGFNLVFSIGTSSRFRYVTQPVILANNRGIPTVEINPEVTPISALVRYRFPTSSGPLLAALVTSS